MSFIETFEDPEMIKTMIGEIKKFAELLEYQEIKKIDKLQFEFAMRDIFPIFAEEHPFLFKKIAMGDDLTFLYKMLDGISQIKNGSLSIKEVEQGLGNDLANAYVYPALNAKANSNVTVDAEPRKKPAFSLSLDQFTNPNILNS
jgi:hypothetical protein